MPDNIGEVPKFERATEIVKRPLFLHPCRLLRYIGKEVGWRGGIHEGYRSKWMHARRMNRVWDRSCITEARFRWCERGSRSGRFEGPGSNGCIVGMRVPGVSLIGYHTRLIGYLSKLSGCEAWFIVHEI